MRRELARSFGATLVVILTIMITNFLIRTVGQAARGTVSPQDVALLLGYVVAGYLPFILSLSLFIAIVVSLGRMYRENEMAVWFASGLSLSRFVRPVLGLSWPVLLLVSLLLLFVWPWCNRNTIELRDRYQQRSDLSRITPGVFQASNDGRRVFFIERDSADGVNARNVFILSQLERGESVTTAKSGRLVNDGNRRSLLLEHGQRNDIDAQTSERTLSSFDSYQLLVSERAARSAENIPPKALHTLELIRNPTPRNQAELTWRFGLLLGSANMLLLAIGLSESNPRRANNWNLVFALLAFVVYYNLINLTQAWVASGRLGMGALLAVLHGVTFLMAVGLLWWREHGAVVHMRWSGPRTAAA